MVSFMADPPPYATAILHHPPTQVKPKTKTRRQVHLSQKSAGAQAFTPQNQLTALLRKRPKHGLELYPQSSPKARRKVTPLAGSYHRHPTTPPTSSQP